MSILFAKIGQNEVTVTSYRFLWAFLFRFFTDFTICVKISAHLELFYGILFFTIFWPNFFVNLKNDVMCYFCFSRNFCFTKLQPPAKIAKNAPIELKLGRMVSKNILSGKNVIKIRPPKFLTSMTS